MNLSFFRAEALKQTLVKIACWKSQRPYLEWDEVPESAINNDHDKENTNTRS